MMRSCVRTWARACGPMPASACLCVCGCLRARAWLAGHCNALNCTMQPFTGAFALPPLYPPTVEPAFAHSAAGQLASHCLPLGPAPPPPPPRLLLTAGRPLDGSLLGGARCCGERERKRERGCADAPRQRLAAGAVGAAAPRWLEGASARTHSHRPMRDPLGGCGGGCVTAPPPGRGSAAQVPRGLATWQQQHAEGVSGIHTCMRAADCCVWPNSSCCCVVRAACCRDAALPPAAAEHRGRKRQRDEPGPQG